MNFDDSKAFIHKFKIESCQKGVLSALTFAVKDLIDIAGFKTGCGNPTWEETHPPAVTHAICVEQLMQAGATCLGKTIADELAFGLLGENYFYGTPLNPKAPDCVPGGSSSGSASAVACELVDFALGTDTGGSVRVPASNCGIIGYRPTHGRISLAGVAPFAPSFDTVGILARQFNVLEKVAITLLGSTPSSQSFEVIYLQDAFESAEYSPTVTLQEIFGMPITLSELHDIFSTLHGTEIWSTLGTWVESVHPLFGPHTIKNFDLARYAQRDEILQNIQMRTIIKKKLNDFLGSDKILCIPTTKVPAPKKGTIGTDRTKGDYYPKLIGLNALSSLASLPQIAFPTPSGSLSFLAASGNDEALINFASR